MRSPRPPTPPGSLPPRPLPPSPEGRAGATSWSILQVWTVLQRDCKYGLFSNVIAAASWSMVYGLFSSTMALIALRGKCGLFYSNGPHALRCKCGLPSGMMARITSRLAARSVSAAAEALPASSICLRAL